jgi:hypothetical protein
MRLGRGTAAQRLGRADAIEDDLDASSGSIVPPIRVRAIEEVGDGPSNRGPDGA